MATDSRQGYLSRLLRSGAKPFASPRRSIYAFGAGAIPERAGLPPAPVFTSKFGAPVDATLRPVVEDEGEGAIEYLTETERPTTRSLHATLDHQRPEIEQAQMHPLNRPREDGQRVPLIAAAQYGEASAEREPSAQVEPPSGARTSAETNAAHLFLDIETKASDDARQNVDPNSPVQSRESVAGMADDFVQPKSVAGTDFYASLERGARVETGAEKSLGEKEPYVVEADAFPAGQDKYPGRAVSTAQRTSVAGALATESPARDIEPVPAAQAPSLRLPRERISFDEDSFLSRRLEAASKGAHTPPRDSSELPDASRAGAAAQAPKSGSPGDEKAVQRLTGKTTEPSLERQTYEPSVREEPETFGTGAEQERHPPAPLFLSRRQERDSARVFAASPPKAGIEGIRPVIHIIDEASVRPRHQERTALLSQHKIPANLLIEPEQGFSGKQENSRTKYSSIEESGLIGTDNQPAEGEGESEAARTPVEPVSINRTVFEKTAVDLPTVHRKIDNSANSQAAVEQSYSRKQESIGGGHSRLGEKGLAEAANYASERGASHTLVEAAGINRVGAHISLLESHIESHARAPLHSSPRKEVARMAQEVLPAQTATLRLREPLPGRDMSPRGASAASRLTINRLDVQIINQPPSAPPKSPPRARPPVAQRSDWRNLDRHYIGRFDFGW